MRHCSSCFVPFYVSRGDTTKFSIDLKFGTEKIKIKGYLFPSSYHFY
jgi:hypothetical protein